MFAAGDDNLYRPVGNNLVNYLDPDGLQSLSLKTTTDPKVKDCGEFASWKVQFKLSEKSKAGGYIVQHFTVKYDVYGCGDCENKIEHPKKFTEVDYWEAWQVNPNSLWTKYGDMGIEDDNISHPGAGDKTKGKVTMRGEAKFYEGLDLPADFKVRKGVPAGTLPSTTKDPKLTGGTAAVVHEVTLQWDCCPGGDRKTTYKTIPKD
jgi:hypothetical protein